MFPFLSPTSLYIDPGTGSMLFTILLGVLGAAAYSLRMLFVKLRFRLTGGKAKEGESGGEKIPLAIFSDDKRYWSVFLPLVRELAFRGQSVTYLTSSPDDPGLSSDLPHFKAEFLGEGNKAFARLNYLSARVLLSTTPGLDVYQWKRSKGVDYYVHLPHAASEIVMYRMFGIDYYDAILLSGDYQVKNVRALEAQRGLPAKELVKVGIPYMDEMAARYRAAGPAPAHERTVLLAPTWGKSGIFGVYGGKIIELLLSTGYHIIVRPHPQSFTSEKEMISALMEKYPESERLEWNRDTDNFEVLRRADILVSDFSGVIFDFALIYDKPVIYTDPHIDTGVYDAWWLKEPIWTLCALPRLGEQLTEENSASLKQLIDRCLTDPKYAEGRAAVKAETWCDEGEGARNAADYLVAKVKELSQKSPAPAAPPPKKKHRRASADAGA